ncbi:MAG: DUF2062 domain-containing protein [Rhodospirillaceae bacterium]|nr:DUF2062 domain-containing protein [Rhodospirillaceae bacterium]
MLRYRFLVPLKRTPHPPEWAARATAVGLFWGLSPTVGIQVLAVFLVWIVARRMFRWDFGLLIAIVWTSVSNVLTAIPLFYSYFITGRLLLGQWDGLPGYRTFSVRWYEAASPELNWFEQLEEWFRLVVVEWGVTMLVGSAPFAILGAWIGYRLTYRFIVRYRRVRAERIARRRAEQTTP